MKIRIQLIRSVIILIALLYVNIMRANNGANTVIEPGEYQQILGNGVDVDWWSRNSGKKFGGYSDEAITEFSTNGIKHVRIRIHNPDFGYEEFGLLEHQIDLCLKKGIVPVIAYSAKSYKENPCMEEHDRVVEWWKKMAIRMKDKSHLVSFNLIIEPSDALKKNVAELNSIYEDCVTAIRESNPKRIIFIAPPNLSNPLGLQLLDIPDNGNGYIMAEWHFYASGPDKKNPKKKWTDGNQDERKLITDKIRVAIEWQNKTGIYTWVGAWMPGNYNKGNHYTLQEQIEFASFVRKELENERIPFAVNSDKVFFNYDSNKWIESNRPLFDVIFR